MSSSAAAASSPNAISVPSGGFIGRYTLGAALVDGAAGKLYRGKDKYGDHEIVLQFIDSSFIPNREAFHQLQRHVRDVSWVWSLNVARVFCLRQVQAFTFLIEAFAGQTNLEVLVSGSGARPPRQALFMGRQVADALALIHGRGAFHLHLKPSGILLDEDGLCKVTGLGLTPFYDRRSPLFAMDDGPAVPNRSVDLQALGQLLAFLLTGDEQWSDAADFEGREEIAPLIEELLAPNAEEIFPETTSAARRLDELLVLHGGQPEIFVERKGAGGRRKAEGPPTDSKVTPAQMATPPPVVDLPPLDELDDPLPPSMARIGLGAKVVDETPVAKGADFDEEFEDGDECSDSTNNIVGFIRDRAEAIIEREEWEAAKRAKRVSRMTLVAVLFLVFWLFAAFQFGPENWRRKGRILIQHFIGRSNLIEKRK